MHARLPVREHAAACDGSGHGASIAARALLLHDFLDLALQTIDVSGLDDAVALQLLGVRW